MKVNTLCPVQKVVAAGRPVRDFHCDRCGERQPHVRQGAVWYCLRVLDRLKRVVCSKAYEGDKQP